jgi:glycosyltransferase involved in cell wall biosynthesis
MKTICFFASDYKFFFRHFSPALSAARAQNAKVYLLLPVTDSATDHELLGVELLPSPIDRHGSLIFSSISHLGWLMVTLRRIKPDVVVAYSLRQCLLVAMVQWFVRSGKIVLVVTGLGLLGLSTSVKGRLVRRIVFGLIRIAAIRSECHFIFENRSDPVRLGLGPDQSECSVFLMGAGVDLRDFPLTAVPACPPLRLATVSRLIWSKGVDVAARVVSTLASEGYPVELSIYGVPDSANPRPTDVRTLQGLPGVRYCGFSEQVADVWQVHHAALFMSRGGEGLPRALLEAAACGRPSIVAAVPGCEDFVRDGVDGYIVPLNDEQSAKEAILKLLTHPLTIAALGVNARERVAANSTTTIVQEKYERLFSA